MHVSYRIIRIVTTLVKLTKTVMADKPVHRVHRIASLAISDL